MIYISDRSNLCNYIFRLDKKFLLDTHINPYEDYKIKINWIDLKKKILINSDFKDKK